jgi:hypothetical protein
MGSAQNRTRGSSTENEMPEKGSSILTSAALIGIGAILEPELLGGMVLGAGAVYVARNLPHIGSILRPMISTAVKAGYSAALKANEMMAEASEDMQDIIAEVRAEYDERSSGSQRSATDEN